MNDLPRTPVEKMYRLFEGTIQLAILLSIPAAAWIYSRAINSKIEDARTQQEYVRIATGILSEPVEAVNDDEAIRKWATEVLGRYSPVPLTEEQKLRLISGESKLGGWGYSDYGYSSYTPNYPITDKGQERVGPAGDPGTPKAAAQQNAAGQPATRSESK